MLTHEEFASLLLVGTPSTYRSPAVIPPEHRARLIELGYVADIQGKLRMTTPGRKPFSRRNTYSSPTQAPFGDGKFHNLRFRVLGIDRSVGWKTCGVIPLQQILGTTTLSQSDGNRTPTVLSRTRWPLRLCRPNTAPTSIARPATLQWSLWQLCGLRQKAWLAWSNDGRKI